MLQCSIPSKHAGSDSKAVWLWAVWPLWRACSQNRTGSYIYARSDFPHPYQLRFFKEDTDHAMQNWPGSDVDGLVWLNTSGPEASRCAGITGPGFWQDATGPLPVSHFQTKFRSSANIVDNIMQNRPGSDLVLADCVRVLAKRIRSGSKPVCKNHPARFRPVLHSRSGPEANRIRHVYWAYAHVASVSSFETTELGCIRI